jgi:hypothetical protein
MRAASILCRRRRPRLCLQSPDALWLRLASFMHTEDQEREALGGPRDSA